jgi:hypothetical protein
MFRTARLLAASAVIAVTVFPVAHATAADVPSGSSPGAVIASFAGGRIDLTKGWGDATACWSDGASTACFRTEAEMDRTMNASLTISVVPLASCSSSLRLYRSTAFASGVLSLTTQNTYINLSAYGFDNDTSSYRVGACAAAFYDGANGGAPVYPGATGAGASASSMVAGWDNRISSVYIT